MNCRKIATKDSLAFFYVYFCHIGSKEALGPRLDLFMFYFFPDSMCLTLQMESAWHRKVSSVFFFFFFFFFFSSFFFFFNFNKVG